TGVWVREHKIASIGVGVRRWIAFHGFALNVDPELSYFADIVPCGLTGVRMTSMVELTRQPVSVAEVKPLIAQKFAVSFGYMEMIWQTDFLTPNSELRTPNLASVASQ